MAFEFQNKLLSKKLLYFSKAESYPMKDRIGQFCGWRNLSPFSRWRGRRARTEEVEEAKGPGLNPERKEDRMR